VGWVVSAADGTVVSVFTGGFFPQPVRPSRSITAHRAAARYLFVFTVIPRFLSDSMLLPAGAPIDFVSEA
jgi:hypothetical protein